MTQPIPLETSRPRRRWVPKPLSASLIGVVLVGALVAGTAALHALPGVTTSVEFKILGIALAVGLDVLALSIAVGIMQIAWGSRIRMGLAFSASEVLMQLAGYALGTSVGHVIGAIADYAGFAVLAAVGGFIVYESYESTGSKLRVDAGWGLLAVCASISLDSLGIGVSLPGVPLPLIPLLATVAVSTIVFTGVGLTFGSQLGARYKRIAERTAGVVLVALAVLFTIQHLAGWAV